MEYVLLAASFAILLLGAYFFTNAVEWFGHRLGLAQGAVGSILAAVATALPESIIPIIAIISGGAANDVAIGAIIGAPFMLATIAMAIVGTSAFVFRKRRKTGISLDAHMPTLERDLGFFIVFFTVGLALGLGAPTWLQIVGAVLLIGAYGAYVRLTLRGGGDVQGDETLKPLYLDTSRSDAPSLGAVILQLVLALAAIIGGSHLFVHELLTVAEGFGVDPLVLSLVLAPLATELPEKANSFFWMRQGKDTLALGNITGAMVFQSTLPVALGLTATEWALETPSALAGGLALAGGAVALWALLVRRRFAVPAIAAWAGLYAVFAVYISVA